MASDDTIRWFAQLDKDAVAIAGGKGANLGELRSMELPVPPGFVITTAGYDHFVAANDLQQRIVALASAPQADEPAAFEAISAQIRDLFLAGEIPSGLAQAIADAYAELTDGAVAVRSSATAEDLPSASFAGQQETYLNIRDIDALLDAVKRCWASLWTARALSYRKRQDIAPEAVRLAVIVQQMVDADAAGILFTANPANGRRDETVIDAAWGLGEAVVGGLVTPDHWVLDTTSGRVLSHQIADKAVMTVRTQTGTEERPVPPHKRGLPAIDEELAAQLARYGAQIEQHYARPMDVEWAVSDGAISILQARPITALPEPSAEPPQMWPVPVEGAYFMRGSIVEQLPSPLSPLFATMAPPEMTQSIIALFRELTGGAPSAEMGFAIINGYAYMYMKLDAAFWKFMASSVKLYVPLFRGDFMDTWREVFRPRYEDAIARWQAKPPQALSAPELLAAARELTYRGTELYTGVQIVIPVAITSEYSLSEFYNRLCKRDGDPPVETLLLGFDSQPIRADKALYDLAQWCRDQPELMELLAATPADRARELLDREPQPEGVPEEVWQEWRQRFRGYLEEFGHTIYNLDFMNPVPADDPGPVFETLKYYMQGRGANPYRRQHRAVRRREQMTWALLGRLDPVRAELLRKLLRWAQHSAPLREDALADVGLGWPLLRRLLLELGKRLVDAGAVDEAEDIFWLEDDEAKAAAARLDTGEQRIDSYAHEVERRKMLWRGRARAVPPQVLPEKNFLSSLGLEHLLPATADEQSGPVLKGVPVSAGTVTAQARVLASARDFATMQAGEILVAEITTPAWTPLFALAAGVVTDIGGPVSHGSIVAREYGVPAVMGTGTATKRIRSGQMIRVDGDAGTVTLVDEVDAGAVQETETGQKSRTKKFAIAALGIGLALGLFLWRKRAKRRAEGGS